MSYGDIKDHKMTSKWPTVKLWFNIAFSEKIILTVAHGFLLHIDLLSFRENCFNS